MAAAAYQGDQVDARAYREEQVRYTEAKTRLERYLDSCRGSVTTAERRLTHFYKHDCSPRFGDH